METLFQVAIWSFVIPTLITLVGLAVIAVLVIAWLISTPARTWLYQLTTTPKQRAYDRALAELEITPQQLRASAGKPNEIDLDFDPGELSHGNIYQSISA